MHTKTLSFASLCRHKDFFGSLYNTYQTKSPSFHYKFTQPIPLFIETHFRRFAFGRTKQQLTEVNEHWLSLDCEYLHCLLTFNNIIE